MRIFIEHSARDGGQSISRQLPLLTEHFLVLILGWIDKRKVVCRSRTRRRDGGHEHQSGTHICVGHQVNNLILKIKLGASKQSSWAGGINPNQGAGTGHPQPSARHWLRGCEQNLKKKPIWGLQYMNKRASNQASVSTNDNDNNEIKFRKT